MDKPTFRRLLLAKQLFLHGYDHSEHHGALNKMIAVHNFHNAIEIVLKAVMLHYEIRPTKELNIGFDDLVNEIANNPILKNQGKKLPYRQQIRNLNTHRNLVQHDAVEPSTAVMDEFRLYTRRFLTEAYRTYFDLDFEAVSQLEAVDNSRLRKLLTLAVAEMEQEEHRTAVALAKLAFVWASESVTEGLVGSQFDTDPHLVRHALFLHRPFRSRWPGIDEFRNELERVLEDIVRRLDENSRNAANYALLVATGIDLVDYKRFHSFTPHVDITFGGPSFGWPDVELVSSDANWCLQFVIDATVKWTSMGLAPSIPDWAEEIYQDKFLDKRTQQD